MTAITITLPDHISEWITAQVAAGRFEREGDVVADAVEKAIAASKGVEIHDDVSFERGARRRLSLEDVFGSVPALPNESADLDDEIAQAMEEHFLEKYKNWQR